MNLLMPDYMQRTIERYLELKETLAEIENGTWHNNPKTNSLSLEQIDNMRYIIDTLDAHGFSVLAEKFRKVN